MELSNELLEAMGLAPFKLKEAVPMGNNKPQTPSEQRASQDEKEGDQVAAPASDTMPGKVMNSPGQKPDMSQNPGQNPTGAPQTPAQQQANATTPINKNAMGASQGQAGAKNQTMPGQTNTNNVIGSTTPPGQPNQGSNQGLTQNDEEDQEQQQQQNGQFSQKRILQNNDDPTDVKPKKGANLVPPTEKGDGPTVKNPGKKSGVTMMSTTRPVPAPAHPLMGSGEKVRESKLLRKIIREELSPHEMALVAAEMGHGPEANPFPVGHVHHNRWKMSHADHAKFFEPRHDLEEKPEPHARVEGYVIKDSNGHLHGCKWVPDGPDRFKDEGLPKVFKSREEAHALASKWTEEEAEQDDQFIDKIIFTVGAKLSDGSYKFPA